MEKLFDNTVRNVTITFRYKIAIKRLLDFNVVFFFKKN